MFKEIGQIASLFKNLPKMKEDMEKMQAALGSLHAEGDAGAGMVKVRVNGHLELTQCSLSDEALKGGDKELLEDLVLAATNQALKKAKQMVAEESQKVIGLPGMPGLGG